MCKLMSVDGWSTVNTSSQTFLKSTVQFTSNKSLTLILLQVHTGSTSDRMADYYLFLNKC